MLLRSLALSAALVAGPAMAQQAAPTPAEASVTTRLAAYVQPSNADRTRVLVGQLRAEGFEPAVETFQGGTSRTGPIEGRNVVITIGQGEREILLVAHYDAVILADGTLAHGLVDNAGSVVALIEAAKVLRDRPLAHRVRIVFFDQEELGLIGAHKWIEAHGIANVAAVVNSDVAAYGDTMMYGLNNGPQSAEVVRVVRGVCADRAMPCVGYPVYPPSDDRAFSAAGVPVVSLGFQDQVGAHQMWLAFNGGEQNGLAEGFTPKVFATIHSAADVMAAVEPATILKAGQVYAEIVVRLDAELAAGVD